MNITVFGYKLRVEIILLCVLLLWFIHANTFFSCAGGLHPGVNVLKEGFVASKDVMKKVAEGLADKPLTPQEKAIEDAKKAAAAIKKTVEEKNKKAVAVKK